MQKKKSLWNGFPLSASLYLISKDVLQTIVTFSRQSRPKLLVYYKQIFYKNQ